MEVEGSGKIEVERLKELLIFLEGEVLLYATILVSIEAAGIVSTVFLVTVDAKAAFNVQEGGNVPFSGFINTTVIVDIQNTVVVVGTEALVVIKGQRIYIDF